MKHYSPTGRRNRGRPLKRLLDTWDRNGSTSGPTPWQKHDDDNSKKKINLNVICNSEKHRQIKHETEVVTIHLIILGLITRGTLVSADHETPRCAGCCPPVPSSKVQIHGINLPCYGPFTNVSEVGKQLAKHRELLSRTEAS